MSRLSYDAGRAAAQTSPSNYAVCIVALIVGAGLGIFAGAYAYSEQMGDERVRFETTLRQATGVKGWDCTKMHAATCSSDARPTS